jgi:hypothetical protein
MRRDRRGRLSCMWSIGSQRSAPIRAHPGLRNSPPSPWSRAASSEPAKSKPNADPKSPPGRSRPKPSPTAHEAIGRSKTTSTGPSTSPSTRISHACAPATAPKTWPWSATSPSIWCAKSPTNDPSSDAASAPLGILNISCRYWGRCHIRPRGGSPGGGRCPNEKPPRPEAVAKRGPIWHSRAAGGKTAGPDAGVAQG